MAHMMKKADFLALVEGMENPFLRNRNCCIYLMDSSSENSVEIYRASNMREEGYISAINQAYKYRKWLRAARK